MVEVGRAGGEFARVTDAVSVAVCLRRVRDGWAVVVGISNVVRVLVRKHSSGDCEGGASAREHCCGRCKERGHIALIARVCSPREHPTIG